MSCVACCTMLYSPLQKLSADTVRPCSAHLLLSQKCPVKTIGRRYRRYLGIRWCCKRLLPACCEQFAKRESVRLFYSTCTHVSAFLSSLAEEVPEIAGPMIQWSAKRSRSAREPGKEK